VLNREAAIFVIYIRIYTVYCIYRCAAERKNVAPQVAMRRGNWFAGRRKRQVSKLVKGTVGPIDSWHRKCGTYRWIAQNNASHLYVTIFIFTLEILRSSNATPLNAKNLSHYKFFLCWTQNLPFPPFNCLLGF
jgi:hypothetical protein